MDARTAELLVCPLCHGPFDWSAVHRTGAEIDSADLQCPGCGTRAAVRDGFGWFLPGDAPVGVASAPAPVDGAPEPPPAPPGWPATSGSPSEWVVERGAALTGTILELGPGSGALAERLGRSGARRPVVLESDVGSLRRRRDRPAAGGAWDGLVVEPHSLPFADGTLAAAVSEFGLQNLPGTLVVLRELRRVVSGELLAVGAFLTEPEGPNHEWARAAGLSEAYDESRCLETFRKARWSATFEPKVESLMPPAGGSEGFPRVATRLRWGLVIAH